MTDYLSLKRRGSYSHSPRLFVSFFSWIGCSIYRCSGKELRAFYLLRGMELGAANKLFGCLHEHSC